MKRFSTTARISLSMAGVMVSLLLFAHYLGLIPDERLAVMEGRRKLCEAMAINFSLLAESGQIQTMKRNLEAVASRDSEILTIVVRRDSGDILAQVGGPPSRPKRLWSAQRPP